MERKEGRDEMSQAWIPDRERKYNLPCPNCGRPTAKLGGKVKEAGLCKHCVQEVLLGQRYVLYLDYKTGETIKGSPNFGTQSDDGIFRRPRIKSFTRQPRVSLEEREKIVRRARLRRKPRLRSKEVDEAFREKAGLVEETLRELG